MFCDLCGTMLKECVECHLCKFRKSAGDVCGREIFYKVTAEDMRRANFEGKIEVKDMEINKKCEKCSNTKLKCSTRQVRSADEGQTTFYHCPKCLQRELNFYCI